jgi:hypothetical protein
MQPNAYGFDEYPAISTTMVPILTKAEGEIRENHAMSLVIPAAE